MGKPAWARTLEDADASVAANIHIDEMACDAVEDCAEAMDVCSKSASEGEQDVKAKEDAQSSAAPLLRKHGPATSTCHPEAPILKLTRRTDNFYEDYLH